MFNMRAREERRPPRDDTSLYLGLAEDSSVRETFHSTYALRPSIIPNERLYDSRNRKGLFMPGVLAILNTGLQEPFAVTILLPILINNNNPDYPHVSATSPSSQPCSLNFSSLCCSDQAIRQPWAHSQHSSRTTEKDLVGTPLDASDEDADSDSVASVLEIGDSDLDISDCD
ncbi:hypothetical protein AC579_6852 [Pseudocercospora musae]|uniref:Uncharacterized protein n=1 Tax=Pseudocercospora musae TaxID=113226 RepID=A0A139I828_9PEZI|nr:hypothetical protein AC579_6852 [Pseudocercospora musae]KXT10756.1 hypothetical protein AC579_6852 [Pseudocercospora musae]